MYDDGIEVCCEYDMTESTSDDKTLDNHSKLMNRPMTSLILHNNNRREC